MGQEDACFVTRAGMGQRAARFRAGNVKKKALKSGIEIRASIHRAMT